MGNAPTIEQLAADVTRAEHLMRAAKVLHHAVADPFARQQHQDLKALAAVLATASAHAGEWGVRSSAANCRIGPSQADIMLQQDKKGGCGGGLKVH